MTRRDFWRHRSRRPTQEPADALFGDDLYGDRESLRRYRDSARDEHRRFGAEEELEHGRLRGADTLTEYDRFDQDLTRSDFHPEWRHATQGGQSFATYGNEYPQGRAYQYRALRPAPGPHRGRGPRGYQRSDERIYEDVCERLTEDERVDPSEVQVSVTDGEVTLSGHLRSRNAKRHVTDLAEQVSGVRNVYNHIQVSDAQAWPPTRK